MCVSISVPGPAPATICPVGTLLFCTFLDILAANKMLSGIQPTNHSWPLPTLLAHVKKLSAPRNIMVADICYGYFDVMGHYDNTFNCSTGTYRFCCGTCFYRFCCEDRHERLDQKSCSNDTPIWVDQQQSSTTVSNGKVQEYNPLKDQTNSTVYVICGVISFTLAVGIGAKIAFNRANNQPEAREINVPRALVDILRHQTVTVNRSERNNSTSISTGPVDNGPARPPKNLYNPMKPLKSNHDNMHHNYIHLTVNSPKHSATLDCRMNNQAHFPGSSMKYNTLSCSRSFHNLSHLPPSYESAMKSDISKYCSLKRLAEKDTDDFYTKRKHLAELTRGTLPLHVMKMTYDREGYLEKSQAPRRVMSQEHILSENYHSPYDNQPPVRYDYTILREQRPMSHERLLSREILHSQEHLLSPERLPHQSPTPFHDTHLGHQKALSHNNVCSGSTPMLDCQHTLKMNSHTTVASSPKATWDAGNSGTTSRRQAFAAKRQNTVEQLQFIPGHHPSYNQQHIHTGSKNEVTV